MKEILKSKMMILFTVFILGIVLVDGFQAQKKDLNGVGSQISSQIISKK
ncbi:MAG TPA: hypothetical protein IAD49_03570 [Candidatus Fimihabitans intestinipullorum]|uniref:Uncharacterized protein n=1 Tax=Candidatus Fimihabitans intestinipullorum TaxID=2840820 RepID=A0A9D1L3I6_9BACT|nr:hypothetical protein [Candidatus Fimihabitans intestinipullorum]